MNSHSFVLLFIYSIDFIGCSKHIIKPLIANEFFLCQLAHPILFYSGLLSSSAPFHL